MATTIHRTDLIAAVRRLKNILDEALASNDWTPEIADALQLAEDLNASLVPWRSRAGRPDPVATVSAALRFAETEPYGDVALNADRAAIIAVAALRDAGALTPPTPPCGSCGAVPHPHTVHRANCKRCPRCGGTDAIGRWDVCASCAVAEGWEQEVEVTA